MLVYTIIVSYAISETPGYADKDCLQSRQPREVGTRTNQQLPSRIMSIRAYFFPRKFDHMFLNAAMEFDHIFNAMYRISFTPDG